jgi:quercetin dioxygenase-like cupin family protein
MTFIDTNHLNVKEPRAGWKGRFFHSQNMTFAYYAVAAGAWIHEHSHANDEVWNVIDGELEIKIAAETQVAGPGGAVVVPPDTAHSVKALTDARAVVVDYPRRSRPCEHRVFSRAPGRSAHRGSGPSTLRRGAGGQGNYRFKR